MSKSQDYCRLCFVRGNVGLKAIDEPTRDIFYSLTSINLIKSEVHSNLICFLCGKKMNETQNYCQSLKKNELSLLSQLPDKKPEIVFAVGLAEVPQFEVKVEQESNLKIVDVHMAYESIEEEEAPESQVEVPNEGSETLPSNKPKRIPRKRDKLGRLPKNPELDEKIKSLPVDEKGKVECPNCSRKTSKRHCKAHILRYHMQLSSFSCDQCGKCYKTKSDVRSHMEIHLRSRLLCQFGCDMSFPSTTRRKAHLKKFHPDAYYKDTQLVCESCARKFNSLDALKRHKKTDHLGLRYKCPFEGCEHEYRTESAVRVHVKNIHEFETEPCDVCGKVLRKGPQMRHHKIVNHVEKKHACKYCGKKFRIKSFLKVHENRHEGIKKFNCKFCPATFYHYNKLRMHILVVHKKQKFFCEIPGCSSEFCNKSNYRVHIKTVHKEIPVDEMTKILERITLIKPIFQINDDQIGQTGDDVPERKKRKQKLSK